MRSELLAGAALALLGLALLNLEGRPREERLYVVAPGAPWAQPIAREAAPGQWVAGAGPRPAAPAGAAPSALPYVGVAAFAGAALVGAARGGSGLRMMFGGGDKGGAGGEGGKGNFLDSLKKAQEMFSPEMMQKYQQVGIKLEQVKNELAETEVACELEDGVTVVFSGTSAPMSVSVSEALCAKGPDAVSAAITKAMKEAHERSGKYAAQQMQAVYADLGIDPAAMQGGGAGGA